MANHDEFAEIVKSSWSIHRPAQGMMNVWLKLNNVKGALKRLNNKEFIRVETKIQNIRDKLKELQAQMRDISHNTE